MNGFLTRHVLDQVRRVIADDEYGTEMVERNYELGKKFFSYSVRRRKLRTRDLFSSARLLAHLDRGRRCTPSAR